MLGGRAMEIVYSREGLADYLQREGVAAAASAPGAAQIFLDRFLEDATELDVDALCDGREVWIGGIMQHVEEAGVHSGDSACVLPPHSLGQDMLEQIRAATRELALAIGAVGLINIQYAVHAGELYVIEANPRASRTVPFVSKAVGLPLAKLACRIMLGESIAEMELPREREGLGFGDHICVKEAVLPFDRFEGSDALLGPEMRSTGEVMGIARDFPTAFAKAQAAAGVPLPLRAEPCSSPSQTPIRRARSRSRRSSTTTASDRRHPRHRRSDRADGRARRSASTRSARARRTCSTGSNAATSTWWSTRRPARAPAPTATRSAARPSRTASPASPRSPPACRPRARSPVPLHGGEPEVLCLQELHGAPRRRGARRVKRARRASGPARRRRSPAGC